MTELNRIKDSTNILQVDQKHLETENYKEFYYIIKVFVDYGLLTVHLSLHLQRNTYNK